METRKHTQLKCSSCLFVAKDERRLGTHEKQHGYKGEFVCDACNYSHDDQKVIQSHMKRHHQGLVQLHSPPIRIASPDFTETSDVAAGSTEKSQKPTSGTDDTSDDQVDSELTSADSTPVKTGSVSSHIVDGGVIPETATSNIDAKLAEPTISPSEKKSEEDTTPNVREDTNEEVETVEPAKVQDAESTAETIPIPSTSSEEPAKTNEDGLTPANASSETGSTTSLEANDLRDTTNQVLGSDFLGESSSCGIDPSALELLNAIASITEGSERESEDNFQMRNSPSMLRPVVRSNSRDSVDRGNIFDTIMSDIGNESSPSEEQKSISVCDLTEAILNSVTIPNETCAETSNVEPNENNTLQDNGSQEAHCDTATVQKDSREQMVVDNTTNDNTTGCSDDKVEAYQGDIADARETKESLPDDGDRNENADVQTAEDTEKEWANEKSAETDISSDITEELPAERENQSWIETDNDENKDKETSFTEHTEQTDKRTVVECPVESNKIDDDLVEDSGAGQSDKDTYQGTQESIGEEKTEVNMVSDNIGSGTEKMKTNAKEDLQLRVVKAPITSNPFEIHEEIKDDDMPIVEIVDPDAKKQRYRCAFCPQIINHSKHHLIKHQRCHISFYQRKNKKCPYNCKKCNYGTNSLPHLKDHLLLHEEGSNIHVPAPQPKLKERKLAEPTRTTRSRSTDERRKSEMCERQTECNGEVNEKGIDASDELLPGENNDGQRKSNVETTAKDNELETSTASAESIKTNSNSPNGSTEKIKERRGSGIGRGRGRGRRSSVKSPGRMSPRSPSRYSPRSPGRSSVPSERDTDYAQHSELGNEVTTNVTKLNDSQISEKTESPTRSPRSRCRARKISKTVAAELANNTAIEHENDGEILAKRPRRKSSSTAEEDHDVDLSEHLARPQHKLHRNIIEQEATSDAASMSQDDDDDEENEDEELDDVDQHIDLFSKDVNESVVKCSHCPFTVKAEDEKAQINLKKHEQNHFRMSKYSCKHCTYSSGRLLVIKKHLEVLHGDPSGLVIQRPKSSVKFTGKRIKMSFSFIKKNAFFKPLPSTNRKTPMAENVGNEAGFDSKLHDTRGGGKRVSPRAKTACPCCVPDSTGDGKRNHNCMQANGSDDDKIDVGEESNENADLDSTLSPASKRVRIEETKLDPLITYDELGKKKGLKCHHCPFELPWNHGVTSRIHAHEACHFRTSQYECTLCGWNAGNVIAAKKHMTIHPDAKPADLLKRWGKEFKSKNGASKTNLIGRKKNRRVVAVSNMEIMKSLTQRARFIKANSQRSPGKYGNNTVGALLERRREENIALKPSGKTIKEILNLKENNAQLDFQSMGQGINVTSPTKDLVGTAKTVRALLDRSRSVQAMADSSKSHAAELTTLNIPKNDDTNNAFMKCQYCPFKIASDAFEAGNEIGHHVKCHFQTSRYTCNKCNFSVAVQSEFKKHLELHAGDKSSTESHPGKLPETDKPDAVTCQYCPYTLRGAGCQSTIKNHEKCHFRRGSFSCKTCNFATNVRENWNKHVKCHRWTEQQGVENLVLSGGKQSPPSPRPSHRPESAETAAEGKVVYQPVYRKARSYMTLPVVLPQQKSLDSVSNESIDTLKCPHCPFEIPVHYRASKLNMERHVACHTANDKLRCNHNGCTFSVSEEQVLEKHRRYHQPWFLQSLPQHWKQNMSQLQVRQHDNSKLLKTEDGSRASPAEQIDVSKYRNPNGTLNVEIYMKSAPILYVKHADNTHAVRCHFCPFQIPLNRNATYGLYENQIRKHEICHLTVGKLRKKNCSRCSFSTRSFDSFKAHCKVHSPEHERKMAAGVLLYSRPSREQIAMGASGNNSHSLMAGNILLLPPSSDYGENSQDRAENMPEEEKKELELSEACRSEQNNSDNCLKCQHCPFYVAPGEFQKSDLENHLKRHFETYRKFRCPKCNYGAITQRLFTAHINLHPDLQVIEAASKKKKNSRGRPPIHQCHTCEFTTSNGTLMFRHVNRHQPNQQKYSTTAVGASDATLQYCGQCSYVTSVSGEMKTHLDGCTGKAQLFHDTLYQDESGLDLKEESTDGEFSDDPGVQASCGKSGVVDESLIWQCPDCDYKTFKEYQLQCHLYHHSPSAKGKFRCEKCGYRAKRDKDYDVHLNFHHISGVVSPTNQFRGESPCANQQRSEVANTPEVTPSPVKEQASVPSLTPVKSQSGISQRTLSSAFALGNFDCEICDYSSTSEFHYMKHMLGHTDTSPSRRYRCSICGYGALKTIRLQQHMQFHHKSSGTVLSTEIETHQLDDPGLHFFDMRDPATEKKRGGNVEGATLQRETHSSYVKVSHTNQHVLVVGNCTRYRCSKCDFVTDKKRMFKTHWYGHTCSKAARPEECPTCGYRTDTRYRLEFHTKKHHKVPGKARDESKQMAELQALLPSPKPSRNGRVSPRSSRPGSPFRAKGRPITLPSPPWRKEPTFYCNKCPFYDVSKEIYQQHQQCHQRVEEFRCLYCTYSTKTKDVLRLHIKTHFTISHQQAALDRLEKELENIEINAAMPEIVQNGEADSKILNDNENKTELVESNGDVQEKICPYCDIGIQADVFANHVSRHTQGAMYLSMKI